MSNPNRSIDHHENPPERKQRTSEQEFDPYEYGREEGIGYWEAAIHLYRYATGYNIILIPFIIKNLGWLMGALTTLGTSILILHITHIILSTEYKVCRRLKLKRLSHPELVGKVFEISPYPLNKISSPIKLVLFVYYAVSAGNASILVIMANGIQTLATFFDLQLETTLTISILVIPLLIASMFRKILKILVPFSLIASILTFCMAIIIIVNPVIHKKDYMTVTAFGDITFIPKSVAMLLGILGVSMSAIAIKNNMAKPKKLVSPFGALNISSLGALVFSYSFGAISYINYGESVRANILLNLPQQSYLSFSVILLYTLSVNVNYLLNLFSRFDNLWTNSLKNKFGTIKYASVLEYSICIALNLIPYLLAVAVPDITVLSTLLGVINIIISVALSAVMELLCLLSDQKKSCWIIFKDTCIIGVCVFIFVVSLYGCVEKIKNMYQK